MFAVSHTCLAIQLTTLVVPVAVYFLVIGLLNTRRTPQLLTGRQDFALLTLAICPLFVLPLLELAGLTPHALLVAAALLAGAIWILAPTGRNWVIYNIDADDGRRTVGRILDEMGLDYQQTGSQLDLADGGRIEFSGFSFMRNVSVRLQDVEDDLAAAFADRLAGRLARRRAAHNPLAVAMLMVATAMLVAPVTFLAHQSAPQLVRYLSDLLK